MSKLFKKIDELLNGQTMYRLMLYYLFGLALIAAIFSFLKLLPYSPWALIFSFIVVLIFCLIFNKIFSAIFKVVANFESAYITAMILFFLILPPKNFFNWHFVALLALVTLVAMASKYLLAVRKSLIFNPAAAGVAAAGLILGQSASWWVASPWLLPFVIIGGLLIVRKLDHSDIIWSFLGVFLLINIIFEIKHGLTLSTLLKVFTDGPILFFVFVMLVEPQTTPPYHKYRMAYGALAALLFWPGLSFLSIYFNPERSLIAANIFSAIISRRQRMVLTLKERIQETTDTYSFIFNREKDFAWQSGQYLEWTIPQKKTDLRGNRRYFTIAAAPTEDNLMIGVKFYPKPSKFKEALLNLKPGEKIIAAQKDGEFILPKDPREKITLIAGGIGITPYRSMIKYLLDKGERRDIVLLYAAQTEKDLAYKDLLEKAKSELGIKVIYNFYEQDGYIDADKIKKTIPDFAERTFYISGAHSMVENLEKATADLGLAQAKVKVDYFPGYV